MGLLDDAIRDHLELKRLHGADPSEVERQEQEALGPARREEIEAPPAPREELRAFDQEQPDEYEPRAGDRFAETTDEEEPVYDDDLLGEATGDESPADPDVSEGRPQGAVSAGLADLEEPTSSYELEELRRAQREADDGERGGSPERGRPEDAGPAGKEPGGEDVLEETPEFLQETPEHDRLWFEQKPPRDFEF